MANAIGPCVRPRAAKAASSAASGTGNRTAGPAEPKYPQGQPAGAAKPAKELRSARAGPGRSCTFWPTYRLRLDSVRLIEVACGNWSRRAVSVTNHGRRSSRQRYAASLRICSGAERPLSVPRQAAFAVKTSFQDSTKTGARSAEMKGQMREKLFSPQLTEPICDTVSMAVGWPASHPTGPLTSAHQ